MPRGGRFPTNRRSAPPRSEAVDAGDTETISLAQNEEMKWLSSRAGVVTRGPGGQWSREDVNVSSGPMGEGGGL